jgi:hypothetical protein
LDHSGQHRGLNGNEKCREGKEEGREGKEEGREGKEEGREFSHLPRWIGWIRNPRLVEKVRRTVPESIENSCNDKTFNKKNFHSRRKKGGGTNIEPLPIAVSAAMERYKAEEDEMEYFEAQDGGGLIIYFVISYRLFFTTIIDIIVLTPFLLVRMGDSLYPFCCNLSKSPSISSFIEGKEEINDPYDDLNDSSIEISPDPFSGGDEVYEDSEMVERDRTISSGEDSGDGDIEDVWYDVGRSTSAEEMKDNSTNLGIGHSTLSSDDEEESGGGLLVGSIGYELPGAGSVYGIDESGRQIRAGSVGGEDHDEEHEDIEDGGNSGEINFCDVDSEDGDGTIPKCEDRIGRNAVRGEILGSGSIELNERLIANRIWRKFDRLSRLDKLSSIRPYWFWGRFLRTSCQPKIDSNNSVDFVYSGLLKKKDKLRNHPLLYNSEGRMNEEEVVLELLAALYFGDEQVKHLETLISAVAFSISVDEVERAQGSEGDGFSRTNLLDNLISGIGSSFRCYQGYECVLNVMNKALAAKIDIKKGGLVKDSYIDNDGVPLLGRPLLDCVVLTLATVSKSALLRTNYDAELNNELHPTAPKEEGIEAFCRRRDLNLRLAIMDEVLGEGISENKGFNGVTDGDDEYSYIEIAGAVEACIRWLSIANLVQLLIAEIVSTKAPIDRKEVGEKTVEGGKTKVLKESEKEKSVSSNDFKLGYPSNEVILNEWKTGLLLRELIGVIASFGAPYSLPLIEGSISKVLQKWSAFLGATAYTISICRPDFIGNYVYRFVHFIWNGNFQLVLMKKEVFRMCICSFYVIHAIFMIQALPPPMLLMDRSM